MASHVNINNLNVLTFIKDIYSSLKHIDTNFNSMKDNVNSRLTVLEDNQKTILAKLELFETLLTKLNETTKETISLDKTLENQLLNKLSSLNETGIDSKLELQPSELTFANILENDYSFADINKSIKQDTVTINNIHSNLLTFSTTSDSGSIPSPLDVSNNENYKVFSSSNMEISNNSVSTAITPRKETLENLLF